MNGKYDEAYNFLLKNTEVELVSILEVNTLINTRKVVFLSTRNGGRNKQYEKQKLHKKQKMLYSWSYFPDLAVLPESHFEIPLI